MSNSKITIAGISGTVGQALINELKNNNDFQLVSGISRSLAGKNLKEKYHDFPYDVPCVKTTREALSSQPDVLIEYTSHEIVYENAIEAVNAGVSVVIGTSGLSEKQFIEIEKRATEKKVGVFAAGNFSITAALISKFSLIAAKYIKNWEIIDFGTSGKIDAPSGTTSELAHLISNTARQELEIPIADIHGFKESRGAELDGTQVHSVRLPGFYYSFEIIFGTTDERLTMRHDSQSCIPYVQGTLYAAKKVKTYTGLKRGLISIMDFD